MSGIEISDLFFTLHNVDLKQKEIFNYSEHSTEDDVKSYIELLIREIFNEEIKRKFSIASITTEVYSSILKILEHTDFEINTRIIAMRLLRCEISAQEKIKHLKEIKRGSLLQCTFLMDKCAYMLITKVDHNPFLDENEFKKRSGLPYDKKVIKAALYKFTDNGEIDQIHIIDSNTKISEYWWKDFLELNEVLTDENNTDKSFHCIDNYLGRKIKEEYPTDHTNLRNNVIIYYRNHDEFDLKELISVAIGDYKAVNKNLDIDGLKEGLRKLPDKHGFDSKFTIRREKIKARFRNIIPLLENKIELYLKEDIPELKEIIRSFKENGKKYIRIKTDTGYDYFMTGEE